MNEDRLIYTTYEDRSVTLTGKVKVWDLANGKLMDVCYTDNIDPLDIKFSVAGITYNIPDYDVVLMIVVKRELTLSEDYFVKMILTLMTYRYWTINDYTFVTNRKVPVQMSKNNEEKKPPQATVELRSIAGLTDC